MKRILLVSVGFLLLMGCEGKPRKGGAVSGTVNYNGKPVNGATLQFIPQGGEKDKKAIFVPVSQEGTFSGAEIPPGEYKIVVQGQDIPRIPPPEGANEEVKRKFEEAHSQDKSTIPFPNKYKNVSTTDLKCTITLGQKESLALDLKD